MPDIEKIVKSLQDLLKLLFGDHVPVWATRIIAVILGVALLLLGIQWLLDILGKIIDIWVKKLWPSFYNAEKKRRGAMRQLFAQHIEFCIRTLNSQESWTDNRFAELEAEVEAEGRRSSIGFIRNFRRADSGLRRERSLTSAIKRSRERLIILEGDPGAGKSVALRHLALQMSREAMKSKSVNTVIPIYINLKELERSKQEPINVNLVQDHILKSLKRSNDRDVDLFLDDQFESSLQNGTWMFLFDSFDEIPEVLSSTESDEIIRQYSNAISEFLHSMNKCRGIIASRQFRGPNQFDWPHFRIVPLSAKRQIELIRNARLDADHEAMLIGGLGTSSPEIQSMSCNPMFLGLLSEHIRSDNSFPDNVYTVFNSYIESRLARDRDRLEKRFELSVSDVLSAAEKIAFCMSADSSLGLSPSRSRIVDSAKTQHVELGAGPIQIFDALEYCRLARAAISISADGSNHFTFAHRRFQEYFVTRLLLREPGRVNPTELLTNARWREAAVVICQTCPKELLDPIMDQATSILEDLIQPISPEYIECGLHLGEKTVSDSDLMKDEDKDVTRLPPKPFPWPPNVHHLLALIQEGCGSRLDVLHSSFLQRSEDLLLSAWRKGYLLDRKLSLEVAGVLPTLSFTWILRQAFASKSAWLRNIAYKQAARLSFIPEDISRSIRKAIVEIGRAGLLTRERFAVRAHLSRLRNGSYYSRIARRLVLAKRVDMALHIFIAVAMIAFFPSVFKPKTPLLLVYMTILATLFYLWSTYASVWDIMDTSALSNTAAGDLPKSAFGRVSLFPMLYMICVFDPNRYLGYSFLFRAAVFLAYLSVVGFSISSIGLIIKGRFLHPLWWPLSLPLALGTYIFELPTMIKDKRAALVVSAPLALLFALLVSGISLRSSHPILGLAMLIVSGSVFAAFLVLFGLLMFLAMFLMVRDIKLWFKWRYWGPMSITNTQLLEHLSSHEVALPIVNLLRKVREKEMLAATEDAVRFVERLALLVESGLREPIDGKFRPFAEINRLYRQCVENKKGRASRLSDSLSSIDPDKDLSSALQVRERLRDVHRGLINDRVLDELCILLEVLRARLQNAGATKVLAQSPVSIGK